MKKTKEIIKSKNSRGPGLGRQGRGGIVILFAVFIFCFLGVFQSAEAVIVTPGVGQGSSVNSLNNGLVGWWTFDNQDMLNGAVKDKSGNGNTGNLFNIATSTFYTQGKFGQALRFDGVNDYLRVPHSASYKSNSQAISFWMYPHQVPSVWYDGILGIYTSDSDSFEIFMNANSSVLSAGSYPWQLTYTIPAKNKWYHVYIETVSGSGKMYINGVLVDTGTVAYGGASNTADFYIGMRSGLNYLFPGYLDEVRIYNRALSASEISQLYKQGQVTVGATQNPKPNQTTLDSGLVGYWTFNNQDMLNGAVRDKSGNGNTGNLINIATSTFYTQGKLGQAFKFDGVNDYVVSNNTFTPTGDFTASAWVYIDRYASTYTTVFATSPYDSTDNFIIYVGSNGQWNIQIFGDGVDVAGSNTTSFARNKWKHVVLMKSSISPYVRFYVDGVLVFSSTSNPGNFTSRKFQVGGVAGGSSYTGAKVDDVRIYNRALSASEISQLYKQGQVTVGATQNPKPNQTTLDSGLVGYWTFNNQDMLNGAVGDKSGNGNTGNLINIATSTFYTQGKLGQAFKFDGVDDYVNAGSASSLEASAYSTSFWVYLNGSSCPGDGYCTFVAKEGATTGHAAVMLISAQKPQCYTANSGTGWAGVTDSTTVFQLNKWYHVVCTNDGSTTRQYVNGVQEGTPFAKVYSPETTSNLSIGRNSFSSNRYLNGRIDDVRVYNRAISASEVKQLYNMGR